MSNTGFDSFVKKTGGGGFFEVGVMKHEGKEYSSGGSMMWKDPKTGKWRAVMYHRDDGTVGTWDGKKRYRAKYGMPYKVPAYGWPSERVQVWVVINGILFQGTWFKSSGDIIRLREMKPTSMLHRSWLREGM